MNYDLLKLHKKTEEILKKTMRQAPQKLEGIPKKGAPQKLEGIPKKGTKKEEALKRIIERHRQLPNTFARLPYILSAGEPGYLNASEIKLHNLKYVLVNKVIEFEYKFDGYIDVLTPDFAASVTVEVPPIPAGVCIEVGWIQVVTDVDHLCTYGKDAILNWDFPEIVTGKCTMVNDSCGRKYPWFGVKTELASLNGPTTGPTFAKLSMYDRPNTRLQWNYSELPSKPALTYIYRKQRFYTFVAIRDVKTKICQIVETITWGTEVAIDVDVEKPLKERATLLGLHMQDSPRIVPSYLSPSLEANGLNYPRANDAQSWIMRSPTRDAQVNPPKNSSFTKTINASHFRRAEVVEEIARVSRIKYHKNNGGDGGGGDDD